MSKLTIQSFNPTMVRLLREDKLAQAVEALSFNPTMVRLLLTYTLQNCVCKKFQSHNGAIAASHDSLRRYLDTSFNPTMVRLLPAQPNHILDFLCLFQSHNGAIAACTSKIMTPQHIGFNPTMVRLLPTTQKR